MLFTVNLAAGWISFLVGALSGACIGIFFHKEKWMGGYTSFSRRLMRLGHIAFFGIGLLNLAFVFTAESLVYSEWLSYASNSFLLAFSMSLICLLTAWKKSFRHLFFIPVLSVFSAVIFTIIGVYS